MADKKQNPIVKIFEDKDNLIEALAIGQSGVIVYMNSTACFVPGATIRGDAGSERIIAASQ